MSQQHFEPGDRVHIPAGTLIHSMATGKWGSSARAQVVTVHHILPGWSDRSDGPFIRWAGSGGYWRSAAVTSSMRKVAA